MDIVNTQRIGGRGRNRTLSDAVLETAALPVSYTPVPTDGIEPSHDGSTTRSLPPVARSARKWEGGPGSIPGLLALWRPIPRQRGPAMLAPEEGVEPSTFGFKVRCAASCATPV